MENYILDIEGVSKKYRLGQIGGTTLREDIQRFVAKMQHKEDPTAKIGAKVVETGKEFYALSNVSLQVKKGEAVGIIGHNGAGKSTLLKLVTKVTAPTEGMIGFNGRVASMLEVGTGFHPELTGRENVFMNGAILGMTKKEIAAKIDEIVEFSECAKFIDTPVKRYSSGMYVKLAFSVAAHLDSEIMIMDEVLAVGDTAFQNKCIAKMREVANSGRTILYVSHNMSTIRALCDRVVVLNHGKKIFDGDIETGIRMYLGVGDASTKRIDLTTFNRPGAYTDHRLQLKSFTLLDRDTANYEEKEKIQGELEFESSEIIKDVMVTVAVRREDDLAVTAFSMPELFEVKKGKNSIKMKLDTSKLAAGKYGLSVIAYTRNAEGGINLLDGVRSAIKCSFSKSSHEIVCHWDVGSWGNIKGSDIEIVL